MRHERVADSCWGAMMGAALYATFSGFPEGWLMPLAATSGVLTLTVTVAGYLRMRYIERRTFDEFMQQVRAQEEKHGYGLVWKIPEANLKVSDEEREAVRLLVSKLDDDFTRRKM